MDASTTNRAQKRALHVKVKIKHILSNQPTSFVYLPPPPSLHPPHPPSLLCQDHPSQLVRGVHPALLLLPHPVPVSVPPVGVVGGRRSVPPGDAARLDTGGSLLGACVLKVRVRVRVRAGVCVLFFIFIGMDLATAATG